MNFLEFNKKERKICKRIWIWDDNVEAITYFKYKKGRYPQKDNKIWELIEPILKKIRDNIEEYELNDLTNELCRITDCYKALSYINKCPKCEAKIDREQVYCSQCGAKLGGA